MSHVLVDCPHCKLPIFVYRKDFNCCIFRHGVFKSTLQQIDPHLPKPHCDYLKQNDLIIGCGKPFRLVNKTHTNKTNNTNNTSNINIVAVPCGYI